MSNITQDIEDEFNDLDDDPDEPDDVTFLSATDLVNECKNRYSNNLPNEETRVRLEEIDGYGSDYINANIVQNESNDISVILTQAPTKYTFCDFWRMVWEQDVPVIMMLTKLVERGRLKADMYWPKLNKEFTYKHVTVRTVDEKLVGSDIVIRELDIQYKNSGEIRTVVHIHYTGWPDFGAPESIESTKKLFELEQINRDTCSLKGPTILHCSAGLGRAGTFASIMFGIHEIENHKNPDVKQIVQHIRRQRHSCVQCCQQYGFIHTFLSSYHPIYH